MHIPDGILSLPIILVFWAISLITMAVALKDFKGVFSAKKIPIYLALGIFVFIMQLIDLPIPGGTTAHLLGGALLALLIGFSPAVVIMASILAIQAFVLHDGGVFALGANIFNMAIIAPFIAVNVKNYFTKLEAKSPEIMGSFIAPIIAVLATSILIAVQLSLSGAAITITLPAMLTGHIAWAALEAVISIAFVIGAINYLPAVFASKNPV